MRKDERSQIKKSDGAIAEGQNDKSYKYPKWASAK